MASMRMPAHVPLRTFVITMAPPVSRLMWNLELDGTAAPFAGPDAHGVVDRQDEDLPIADGTRARGFLDDLDDLRGLGVVEDDLDLHLGDEVDDVLGAPVELRVSLLSPEALHLRDGQALHPGL